MYYVVFIGFLLTLSTSSFPSEIARTIPCHFALEKNTTTWGNPMGESFFFIDNIRHKENNFPEDIKNIMKNAIISSTQADIKNSLLAKQEQITTDKLRTIMEKKDFFLITHWEFMNLTKENKKTVASLKITKSLYKQKKPDENIDFFIMDNEKSYKKIMALPAKIKEKITNTHGSSVFYRQEPSPLTQGTSFSLTRHGEGILGALALSAITFHPIQIISENNYCSPFICIMLAGASFYIGYEFPAHYEYSTVEEELVQNGYIEKPISSEKNKQNISLEPIILFS